MKMQKQYKTQTLFLLILLMCLIPLTECLAAPVTGLSVVGDSTKSTQTTDTGDITFTVKVTRLPGNLPFWHGKVTVSTDPNTLTATPDTTDLIGLAVNGSQDVTVTVTRAAITTAGSGTYTITFSVDESFTNNTQNPDDPATIDLTLTVTGGTTQTYGVTAAVQGSTTQTTTTAGTADIEYTIRVTNTGNGSDSFTLGASGVPDASLDATSISNLVANAFQDVTLTVPRTSLATVGTYTVTVTATSDGDTNESDTATTETIVNEPAVYGLTLLNVGYLEQTTAITDTADIVYTLRVTNIGSGQDTIDITKAGHIVEQVRFNQESFTLAAEGTADLTVTLPRTAIGTSGTYRQVITATSQGDSTAAVSLTIITTVTDASIPQLRLDLIELEVVGGWRQVTKTTDTEDITYTLLVTNKSIFNFLQVDFIVTGDLATATITPASVELFGSLAESLDRNKIEEVTLTIPRDLHFSERVFISALWKQYPI